MKNSYLCKCSMVGLFSLVFLATAVGARAHPTNIQDQDDLTQARITTFDRPDPEGVPTKVYVGMFIFDLISIDDVSQSFKADFWGILRWNDPRLAIANPSGTQKLRNFGFEEIWHPMAIIINQRNLSKYNDDFFLVDSAGNVQYMQRFYGELSSPFELKDFPFDKQKLTFQLGSMRYGPDEIEFVLDQQRSGMRDGLVLTGWSMGPTRAELKTEHLKVQGRDLARMDFIIDIERQEIFYIVKTLIPLVLIIFMAWAVFFINPTMIGPQIGIPTSSVFSLIVFNHRMSTLLPRVSYLTRLDRFILFSIILVFITIGESVLTAMLAHTKRIELALKIDKFSRRVYLILFLGVIVYSFVL